MISINKSIESQKQVAREVLSKLQACDPYCILAGGSPRNWFFGKEANDLDFYIHLNRETIHANELRFKSIGLNLKLMDFNELKGSSYKFMEYLFRVYEGRYKGVDIQIMVMHKPTFTSVVDDFGVSICEFWWNGGEVRATKTALVSVLTKTLFYKSDYSAKEAHIQKMVNYFPDYTLRPYPESAQASHWLRKDIEAKYHREFSEYSGIYYSTLLSEAVEKVSKGDNYESK